MTRSASFTSLSLLAAAALAMGAAGFAACKSSGESTTGAGGSGGDGSVASSSARVASSSTGVVDAGPIVCSAEYSTVPKGECDVLQQDCPAGSTCAAVADGASATTKCGSDVGLKAAGETCSANSECADKLFCVEGKCAGVCCPGSDDLCKGGTCTAQLTVGSFHVAVCSFAQSCQLLTNDACPDGFGCHVGDATKGKAECLPLTGTGGEFKACSEESGCGDEQDCWSGDSQCHWYCFTDGSGSPSAGLGGCPAGEQCVAMSDGKTIDFGISHVGLCFVAGAPDAGPPDAGDDGGPDGGTNPTPDAGSDGGDDAG